jgi:phosphoribosylanthranilate isomerase
MQTSPIVYVSRITNLSDARYCAGMGAQLLGYVIDPSHPDYVSPENYQQMVGWISGPARVLEIPDSLHEDLTVVQKQYAPDYFHISYRTLRQYAHATLPLIVDISLDEFIVLTNGESSIPENVSHWIITDVPQGSAKLPVNNLSVLIAWTNYTIPALQLLEITGASGICLKGSHETTPGLKDYDHLSKVLEEFNS